MSAFVILVLAWVVLVLSWRVWHWRNEARQRSGTIDSREAELKRLRARLLDSLREVDNLRQLLAGHIEQGVKKHVAGLYEPSFVSAEKLYGRLEAYCKAMAECGKTAKREGDSVGARNRSEIYAAIAALHAETDREYYALHAKAREAEQTPERTIRVGGRDHKLTCAAVNTPIKNLTPDTCNCDV